MTHNGELAFGIHTANARVEAGVVVGRVNFDAALGRIEVAALNMGNQLGNAFITRQAQCIGKDVHLEI